MRKLKKYLDIVKYIGIICLVFDFFIKDISQYTNQWYEIVLFVIGICLVAIQSGIKFSISETKKYKNTELIDKGKELNYYKLSLEEEL